MPSSQYVALLRGINVGGKNKVPMAELRAAFEDAGHTDVRTYIQSGNVLFRSSATRASLEADVERMLERHLGYPLVVVVRSHAQLRSVVENAPAKFGAKPDTFHSDAIFLRAPLTPSQVMKIVRLRDGVDQAWAGRGVVYFARLECGAHEEPHVEHRRHARVRQHDHQELGDHDEAAGAPRRRMTTDQDANTWSSSTSVPFHARSRASGSYATPSSPSTPASGSVKPCPTPPKTVMS